MPMNIIVRTPEWIRDRETVDDILERMTQYDKEYVKGKDKIVVLMLQNTQLGAIYTIEPRKVAEYWIKHPRTCEWGIKFYPREYFEELRDKLGNKTPTYA